MGVANYGGGGGVQTYKTVVEFPGACSFHNKALTPKALVLGWYMLIMGTGEPDQNQDPYNSTQHHYFYRGRIKHATGWRWWEVYKGLVVMETRKSMAVKHEWKQAKKGKAHTGKVIRVSITSLKIHYDASNFDYLQNKFLILSPQRVYTYWLGPHTAIFSLYGCALTRIIGGTDLDLTQLYFPCMVVHWQE